MRGEWVVVSARRGWMIVGLAFALTVPAEAQDRIRYSSSARQGYTTVTGRVIDYTGRDLIYEMASGVQRKIPAHLILDIETEHVQEHTDADTAFANGEFDSALVLYDRARRADQRTWVRRQITARMVWCYRALGRTAEACEEFMLLVRSDPETIYFDCIPLAWVPGQPPVALERKAREWLARKDMAVAALLGASHLMSTSMRQSAIERLNDLAAGPEGPVAQFALAQTWRAQVVSADAERLAQWQRTIEAMPEPLRAGPYCVLGRAWAQRQNWEQSALAWLRVPVAYPRHRVLAARGLVEAGRALGELDRDRQAARLFDEAAKEYPETPSAAEARKALEAIGNEHAG